MAEFVVLYKNPNNAEAFDSYCSSIHVPIAKKTPGLKKTDTGKGDIGTSAGP